LIEFKDEEESPTSELYACVGVQGNKAIISEEEVDAESTIIYRWLDEDEMGKIKYDKDQDKVPFFADCNEESDQVYGMFAPYFVGTGAKVPTVVCGDGIPNTCGSHEFFFEGEPEQDECDNNKVSCLNDCLRKENKCGWIDDEDGKCCGDDGLEDIGILSEGDGESHICLNKDNVFVSPSPPSDLCENDFCWVEATLLPGKIFTIKKPDEIYDVASDGASWRNCEDNVNLFSSDQAEHITQANRLSCYSEGNRYVWAQCFKKGSEESVSDDSKNGIKNRFIGDGLFSLPLPEPSEGNSVEISIEEEYETFYGSLPVDFIGYDKIHVFFTFKELEDFPAKLDMGFYSGGFNLENLIFKKNIIGYATNNPVLEEGRTIHLEINIPNNLIGIDNLKFKTNGDNEIILNNVYFSIGEEIPKICSGEESNTKQVSSWLDNYGQDGDVSAENVCNALFDPFSVENEDGNFPGNAWIKNAENEGDRCCGDQKNEYYTGEAIEG